MYLVIAEKPSVSRAIAEVIGAQEREDGYLQGTDCMVSWCFGHLAEYVSPDAYDEKFNQWRYADILLHSINKIGGLRNMAIGDLNIVGVEAYPIGSIYMSFNSTEPSKIFVL